MTNAASASETSEHEDYVRSSVPSGVTSTGLHLALIIIGGTIGFSVFLVAAQIGGSLGYTKAAAAFTLGSLVLGVMGAMTSYVGARTRLSTYLLTEFAFGRHGAKLANLMIALSLIGWYGVISNFLGQAGQQMLRDALGINVPVFVMVLIASALMIYVTMRGFTGIDKLALYLVPIMLLFLGYAVMKSLSASEGTPLILTSAFSFQTAVSAVVGSYIAGVIIQPDYSRFARSRAAAIWSVFIALGVAFPMIQFMAAIPSLAVGNPDLLAVMATLGLSIPAFFLLALGAWSSNVLCLYSAGLSIATLPQGAKLPQIVAAIGIVGTAIAFVPAQGYLVNFLVVLGVLIPPIGAIYLVEAFILRKFDFQDTADSPVPAYIFSALVSWAGGVAFGFLSQAGIAQIFGIASIDSLLMTAFVRIGISFVVTRRQRMNGSLS